MKKLKDSKILYRDRYGIIRCTLVLSLLLIGLMALNMHLHDNRNARAAEERASDAARQIAAQFQQLIEDSAYQIQVAVAYLQEDGMNELTLEAISRNKLFTGAALLQNSEMLLQSGNCKLQDDAKKSAQYSDGNLQLRLLAQDDNSIQLRTTVQSDLELAVWISPDLVEELLSRAFEEEYGYAVFNVETGVYLLNHTHYTEQGYYDALLNRNAGGAAEKLLGARTAQAYIHRDAGAAEPYYIAQMPTGIGSWSVALLIPENLIDFDEGMPVGLLMLGLITMALSVLAVALVSIIVYWKVVKAENELKRENQLLNQLATLAAEAGQVSIFQYKRKEDQLDHYIDGIGNVDGEAKSLAELCGCENEDAERLQSRCRKLKVGMEDELNIHAHTNGDERFLRICLKSSTENENVILGCIQDCTQGMLAQNRAMDESNFHAQMKPKSTAIWQVNASRNRWHVSHCINSELVRRLNITEDEKRDYEADLNNGLRHYLHPDDYPAYVEEMSINGIMTMFRKGKVETVHEYRVEKPDGKGYEWHRQVVRTYEDPRTHEIMANIFIINVDGEKKAEMERRERARMLQSSLTALGGLYRALFYVDLDADICYTAKAPGGELISKHRSSFRTTFDAYIDQTVAPEDRAALKELTNAYLLRKNMSETAHKQCREYRRISGDSYKRSLMIVQAARFENGTVRDVVIALRTLD